MKPEIIDQLKNRVLEVFIETGSHVFVSDLMAGFQTNAVGVRKALGDIDFVFDNADRWQGDNYSGRHISAPCVEPTKRYLAKIIKSLKEKQCIQSNQF
jgi:hypothetical protein